MFADLGISESTQPLPQPDVCPFLVQAGQATISSHISRKDSCKPPFQRDCRPKRPPEIGRSVGHIKAWGVALGLWPMSKLGHNRESSMRAKAFACSPNNGHRP